MKETYQLLGSLRVSKSNVAEGISYSLYYFTDGEELLDLPKSEEQVYLVKNVNAIEFDSKIRNFCRLASDGRTKGEEVKLSEEDLKESLDELLIKQGVKA